jgi:hypothetical protein
MESYKQTTTWFIFIQNFYICKALLTRTDDKIYREKQQREPNKIWQQ